MKKGWIPNNFEKCLKILIPKKKKSEKYENHRAISLITHTLTLLTKIVYKRIETKVNDNLEKDQFEFGNNKGSRARLYCA